MSIGKHFRSGHISEHALFKAIVQEGQMADTF
jgi:hypothetical protein